MLAYMTFKDLTGYGEPDETEAERRLTDAPVYHVRKRGARRCGSGEIREVKSAFIVEDNRRRKFVMKKSSNTNLRPSLEVRCLARSAAATEDCRGAIGVERAALLTSRKKRKNKCRPFTVAQFVR